jgi:large conductance mechanosensitive channel
VFDEFKRFLLRGNVVELGVGVIMGVAFKGVIDALVADMMTPLIAALGGNTDFSALTFSLNGSVFRYGNFVNVAISFALTAAVVFYLVMTPMNHLMSRYMQDETPEPTTRKCPFCVSDIPLIATRCGHCTSDVSVAA